MRIKFTLITILILIICTGVFIYKFTTPAGAISLNHFNDNGLHVAQIRVSDLTVPFFGTAFHLDYDPSIYTYDHYTLGDYFSAQDSPITLATNVDDTVITGISLKRGAVINKPSGTLINLYFKKANPDIIYPFTIQNSRVNPNTQNGNFSFSNAIFSTYSNGRKDIDSIIFKSN